MSLQMQRASTNPWERIDRVQNIENRHLIRGFGQRESAMFAPLRLYQDATPQKPA